MPITEDIANKIVYADGTKTAIHDAIVAKGVNIDSGATFRSYATSIASIATGTPTLPDLVAGGTYLKQDGTPVTITPISGETTAVRLLVASTGTRKVALVFDFSGTVTIDWGDGTTTTPTKNVAAVHTYDNINPIPCGRPYGVYYVTATVAGGTFGSVAASSSATDWGSMVGTVIAVAVKSSTIFLLSYMIRSSNGATPINYLMENVYYDIPSVASLAFALNGSSQLRNVSITNNTAVSTSIMIGSGVTGVMSLDFSHAKFLNDFTATTFFANCTSILFNTANTELGNINIQYNSLSVDAFVALFNSLPIVTSKTLQIGGSAAALSLSASQLEIATNKGWTVTRTY